MTNITNARLDQLVELVELGRKGLREDMDTLRDEFGLQDFEGRSYAGWHHHVTLVSAAHVYRVLGRMRRRQRVRRPRTGGASARCLKWTVPVAVHRNH
jgi:SRSO17 transposase